MFGVTVVTPLTTLRMPPPSEGRVELFLASQYQQNKPRSTYAEKTKIVTLRDRGRSKSHNGVVKTTTIKPKETSTTSIKTKSLVQAKIDVRKMKIGTKNVKNIKSGRNRFRKVPG
ncbi:hypothetical protein CDAR_494401 [Caerostris darwini]|uniref:Uncharacterized protein n=1 Tax=Caerostris darwini TaxID=1538125 RepID=A0AAV4VF62_9ARAC|nr:hypothetical protein CDAR_494401 [Caerostris darwini]